MFVVFGDVVLVVFDVLMGDGEEIGLRKMDREESGDIWLDVRERGDRV